MLGSRSIRNFAQGRGQGDGDPIHPVCAVWLPPFLHSDRVGCLGGHAFCSQLDVVFDKRAGGIPPCCYRVFHLSVDYQRMENACDLSLLLIYWLSSFFSFSFGKKRVRDMK